MKVGLVVFLIGEKYIKNFETLFKKNLLLYCNKYNYELIILSEFIHFEQQMDNKKFFWQRLLIPDKFKDYDYDYIISIDSDIYINSNSPPLPLNEIPEGKVAAVNERKYFGNYEWREKIQQKMGYEKTGRDWYALSGEYKNYNDHINAGLIIYQPKFHAKIFLDLYKNNIANYRNYHQDDQSIISSFVIDNDLIYWLDERFNRIWFFWKEIMYPNFDNLNEDYKKLYIRNFIDHNYFTHFTGGFDSEYIHS
jgi:hypothetical protein